jgi:hypothetical protein
MSGLVLGACTGTPDKKVTSIKPLICMQDVCESALLPNTPKEFRELCPPDAKGTAICRFSIRYTGKVGETKTSITGTIVGSVENNKYVKVRWDHIKSLGEIPADGSIVPQS